jgi:UDP-N-acetylglucosamine--N-acetylmuramyl-(pentapeptide) pyrophosphoryl-undecaprenol N-acetylglucosamine transferase
MTKKILMVGGGSGGHVTPIVAVIRELRKQQPHAEIRVWCDRGFYRQARSIIGHFDTSIPVQRITAGKLRRYHHFTLLQHFTVPWVFWPNVRDVFLVIVGTIQSLVRLIIWRPDVVFTKGGFVCLPVGWAAWLLRIPVVIHDSDAHPGLTNRLLAPSARRIATGAPIEYYPYPEQKTQYIGIPISEGFRPFTETERRAMKQELGFDPRRALVVITGGGLGAKRLNDNVALHLGALLERTNVLLISGTAQYDELRSLTPQNDARFQLRDFVSKGMAEMLGAADVVVARAGATSILELAALAKPAILVPNAKLTGGHQTKNAQVYAVKKAVILIDEDRFDDLHDTSLVDAIERVLGDATLRESLGRAIHTFARPHAAKNMADMILASMKS